MSSFSGLSKADQDIIAQGVLGKEERVAKATPKGLFGQEDPEKGEASASVPLRGPQFGIKPSLARRVRGTVKSASKPSPQGKAPVRVSEDDSDDEQELEWEEYSEPAKNKISQPRTRPGFRTFLDWPSFDWKPDPKNFLKGISNYSIYKEPILLLLECIGYSADAKLTQLDELKLAAVVQRTVSPELAELIASMKSGTAMMRLFESTFKRERTLQMVALWGKLFSLKYCGGCPVNFVTRFKTDVRNYQNAGGSLSDLQIMMFFKQAVKEKARKWHDMVSNVSQFQEWKIGSLLQNFTSHHHERIENGEDTSRNEKPQFRGTLGSTQGQEGTPPKKNPNLNPNPGKGKGRRNQFRCYKCGGFGHLKKNCQKKQSGKGKTTLLAYNDARSDLGPPEAVADEYCKILDEQLSGGSYATQVQPQTFDEVVGFYEKEIERRREKIAEDHTQRHEVNCRKDDADVPNPKSPTATIQVTQQILSTAGADRASDRWLFDTGADIDGTNNRKNFRSGTFVDLRPGQFPIQTGNGTVHAESMGEVWNTNARLRSLVTALVSSTLS